jgi:hypothetical protein
MEEQQKRLPFIWLYYTVPNGYQPVTDMRGIHEHFVNAELASRMAGQYSRQSGLGVIMSGVPLS